MGTLTRFTIKKDRRAGSALVLIMLMLSLAVLPLIGLAIDGTIMYLIRAKVSQACDAAALAGARSLSTGLSLSSQTASAQATSRSYFAANFQNGYMGVTYPTDGTFPTVNVTQGANSTRIVSVTASVTAPTYFMNFLGMASSIVGDSAQASRRDVNLMLVLDRSGSMQTAGVCPTMIANAQSFVGHFADGQDELGLITFMAGSNVDYSPSLTFKSGSPTLTSVIGTLVCGGHTGSAQALTLAYQQIKAVNQPGRLNVIVFFTDGQPNGITIGRIAGYPNAAPAPIKTLSDTRYGPLSPFSLGTIIPSLCPGPLSGAIAQDASSPPPTKGTTSGLYQPLTPNINVGNDSLIKVVSCLSNTLGADYLRNDLAYIPATDSYGNSTTGTPMVASDFFTTGPYAGQVRPDSPLTIEHASTSAAYGAASTIHTDTTFNIVTYTIGLGGTSQEPVNHAFLATLANDPVAVSQYGGTYNASYPQGLYIYSPTIAQLTAAYTTIASQILRLSQ